MDCGAVHLAAMHLPCDDLGGDFFDARQNGDELHFLIADVVGHGVTAAMLAGMLATTWSRALREGLDLEGLHERLWDMVQEWDDERFLTAFLGSVDLEWRRVRWIGAGHPPGLLLGPNGSAIELESQAPMLSPAFPWLPAEPREMDLGDEERLFVFTDGLEETRDPSGELFGAHRLRATVGEGAARGALPHLLDAVEAHRGRRPREDDLTALLLWKS